MSFKIPNIPPTTDKGIRFPNDVIDQVVEAVPLWKAYRRNKTPPNRESFGKRLEDSLMFNYATR